MLSENELLRSIWNNKAKTIPYTDTAAVNAVALTPGIYYLVATTDCHFEQGDADTVIAVAGTTAGDAQSNFLPAGGVAEIHVPATGSGFVSVVRSGSVSGTAYLNRPSKG